MKTIVLLLLISFSAIFAQRIEMTLEAGESAAQTVNWRLGDSYAPLTINFGDIVEWSYSTIHTVEQFVNEDNYNACDFTGATFIAGSVGNTGNHFFMMFDVPGTYYFGCSIDGHCLQGMKIAITVRAAATELETEVATEVVTDIATEVVTDIATEVITDIATEVVTDTDTEVVTDTDTEVVTDTDTEVVTDTDTEVVTDTDTEVVTNTDTEVVTDTDTEVVTNTDTEVVTNTDTEVVTDTDTEVVTDTDTEVVTDTDTEVVTDTDTEVVTDTDTEVVTDTDTEVVTDTETEVVTNTDTEVETETKTQVETCHNGHEGTCVLETYPSASALSEDQLGSNCVYGTYLFGGYCACWSGAYGKECKMGTNVYCSKIIAKFWTLQSDIHQNCYPGGELDVANNDRDFCMDFSGHSSCPSLSSWGSVLPLSTLNPPRMESASFASNNLRIIVSQPIVNGRADGAAFLNDNKLNKTAPYCTYPVSDYIFKEVDGCKDIWRFDIPWNLASQCGWDIRYQEGYKIYKGQVIIHNHEYTENIHDCRFIQSVLRIQLRFQLFVQVTLSSVVYNQPNLQSAITQQIVAVNLGEEACIQLSTVLNYPYMLQNGALVSTPQGKVISHTFSSKIEECEGLGECRQRWASCLKLTNDTCDLNGPYKMTFTKECRSTGIECPLLESDKPTTIDFTLVSENFCAEISVDIGLYGSIQVYEDSTFTVLRSSFIVGRRACFLVSVNSDSNPSPYAESSAAIKLVDTKLWTVTIRVGAEAIVKIFDKGAVTSTQLNTQLMEIDMEEGNKVGFCYYFSKELVLSLNCTGYVEVVTGAEVQVYYDDGNHVKRDGTTGSDQTTLSASNTLDTNSHPQNDNNFGNIIYASLLLVFFALFF